MDHESQDANRCNESKLTWSEETKEVIESLMARFQLKERQLSDREQQLDNERNRLRKLQNEVCCTLIYTSIFPFCLIFSFRPVCKA